MNGNPNSTAAENDDILFSDRRLNPDISQRMATAIGRRRLRGRRAAPATRTGKTRSTSDKDFNDLQFDVKVCATPLVAAIVDEDDINNTQSTGTSPNDGTADGSETGNPPVNDTGPAIVSGNLDGLVKVGTDEDLTLHVHPATRTRRDCLEDLGLRSKGDLLSYDLRYVGEDLIRLTSTTADTGR